MNPYAAFRHASLRLALVALALQACTTGPKVQLAPDEKAVLAGSRVRNNTTINTDTFRCFDTMLSQRGVPVMNVAIGNIADYTGKSTDTEGAVITKGGSLMLFSALGLMSKTVRLHDRFDTSVTDLEMTYSNARQLGDGTTHDVDGQSVPWLPYYGGSIQKSDYTILGGITEVNFNVDSGGYSAQVNQIGPKARSFTMSVAADLRLVETGSLVVVATASFQKQFTGYEVGADVFSFFDVFNDKQLFDVYAGNISQEPIQLGVRAILEEATLNLLSQVTEVDYAPCAYPKAVFEQPPVPVPPPPAPGEKVKTAAAVPPAKAAAAEPAEAPTNAPIPAEGAPAAAPAPAPSPAVAKAAPEPGPAPAPDQIVPVAQPAAATGTVKRDMAPLSPDQSVAAGPQAVSTLPQPPQAANGTASAPAAFAAGDATTKGSATTGTIMVGSFQMEAGAKRAGRLLAGIGLTPTIKVQRTETGSVWSVRVFTSRSAATLKRVQSLGFPDAYYMK